MTDSVEIALVGRDREIAVVRRLLDGLGDGRSATLIVEGDAGIGKTSLVDVAVEEGLARGALVLAGAAHPFERSRPFGAVVDALGLRRGSSDPSRAAIGRLLMGETDTTEASSGSLTDLRYRIVEDVVAYVEALCGDGPVVLVLEDLHWADSSTLLAVRALTHRLVHEPLVLIVSMRPSPRSAELDQLLDDLGVDAHLVQLGALSSEEVTALACAELGGPCGPQLIGALDKAAGNPMWVREILAALAEMGSRSASDGPGTLELYELPDSLRELVVRRLRYLPDATLEMLRFTAVLGDTATVRDLASITHRPASDVMADLVEAFRSGVLGERGEDVVFRHELVHDAVYQDMPRPVRQALHRDAATALADSGSDVLQVADHLARGATRGDLEAVNWLRRAAQETAPVAPPVTVELLVRAESLLPAGHDDADLVSAELVDALLRAGRVAEAAERAEAVLDRRHRGDVDVPLRLRLVSALSMQNRAAELIVRAESTLAETSDLSAEAQALVLAQASIGLQLAGDLVTGEDTAHRALSIAEHADDGELIVWSLTTLAKAVGRRGRYGEALDLTGRAVALAATSQDLATRLRHPKYFHAMALADADRFSEASAAFDDALDEYDELASPRFLGDTMIMAATTQFLTGAWDDARIGLTAGLRVAQEQGLRILVAPANAHLATIAIGEGDRRRAEELLAPFEAELSSETPCFGAESIAVAAARLAEAADDHARAYELLRNFWLRDAELDNRYFHRDLGPPLTRLALARGDLELANGVTALIENGAALAEVPTVQSSALRCRGLVDGDPELMLEAVAIARTGDRPVNLADTCEDAVSVLAAAGRKEEAKPLLLEALKHYDTMGAPAWAARAGAELRRLGVRRGVRGPRLRATTGWESLTATELAVSKLVAEGLTNKEVAGRLHISPHTVNTHLRHVFDKLDVTNRAALAAEVTRRASLTT